MKLFDKWKLFGVGEDGEMKLSELSCDEDIIFIAEAVSGGDTQATSHEFFCERPFILQQHGKNWSRYAKMLKVKDKHCKVKSHEHSLHIACGQFVASRQLNELLTNIPIRSSEMSFMRFS